MAWAYNDPEAPVPVFLTTREELTEIYSRALLNGCIELECGCLVEPDGSCWHGNNSPLLEAGLI